MKSVKKYFPIKNIENGILELKNNQYCKFVEVKPINFELKSIKEQEDVLYKYKAFLNSCDFDIQILVQSKQGNLDNHIKKIEDRIEVENNKDTIELMKEYINMIKKHTLKTMIVKRFYIVFKSAENNLTKEQAILELNEKTLKIKNSLAKCGNVIKEFTTREIIMILYRYMNEKTSKIQSVDMLL